jgi:hypothetical protein
MPTTTSTTTTTTTPAPTTSFSLAALTSELVNDPVGMGYAPLITAKIPDPIVALLNSLTSPGAGGVSALGAIAGGFTLTNQQFFQNTIIATALFQTLPTLSAALQAGWANVFNWCMKGSDIPLSAADNPNFQSLLQGMVSTGLLTQAQMNSINGRTGSRAEVLWGAGTIITISQVNNALRAQGFTGS